MRFNCIELQAMHTLDNPFYYINTNEIPGELSHENLISSHVKITLLSSHVKISPLLWLHNKSHLSQEKTVSEK